MEKKTNERSIREGLMLCMLLAASVDEISLPEELREISRIASQEQEFANGSGDIEELMASAEKDLHKDPDELLARIGELLPTPDRRRRGLELATRVVTADGIITGEQRGLLETMVRKLGLQIEALDDVILGSQKRLVRFMMLYLAYLTAMADGEVRGEEFERMIPAVLAIELFSGISTDEFQFMTRSVRRHLDLMSGGDGIAYVCATIKRAADLLDDGSIATDALRLVSKGIFADGILRDSEKRFFLGVAEKLGLKENFAYEVMAECINAETHT